MLVRIVKKNEILAANKLLGERLAKQLQHREGPYTIGYPSGNFTVPYLLADARIWYRQSKGPKEAVPRLFNSFGISSELRRHASNDICVEVNVPYSGDTRQVAGFFARDNQSGKVCLMHNGKVGGGRKGVGKVEFLKFSGFPLIAVESPERRKGDSERAVLVAALDSTSLLSEIANFVRRVYDFKNYVREEALRRKSDEEIAEDARVGTKKPKRKVVETVVIERNASVAEFARRRAKGKCELCESAAPFADKHGFPFLEVHHIIWLSEDGEDTDLNTVALCPNCHRKMHIVNSSQDVEMLKRKAVGRDA